MIDEKKEVPSPTLIRSLKALAEGYEKADAYNRPAIGWYLRKVFRAFNSGEGK
jgi:hypothetical protein